MFGSLLWIVVGGLMFMQSRKAQNNQERAKAIIWMVGSAIFGIVGALGLLGNLLT